jgi:putative membrane-bound dehydrogenase-like protein
LPAAARLVLAVWLVHGRVATADRPPTPSESLGALRLADPTLRVELVASDPEVESPVAIAWDEHSRLFVAEMSDYPVAPSGGRIKRLEDRDGDGRFEHATVFADRLPFPSGVLPWGGGVLVTAAPDLLFLKDTDGDGRADVRRVVLTGFAEGNQQLRVNSPTWGLDNWVYLANGRSGGALRRPGDPPGKAVLIPRNDVRVRPDSGMFEPVSGFSQFGLPRDDRGDRFPSWNTVPLRHVVLEERLLARNPYLDETRTVAEVLDLSDGGRVFSLAPPQRRFNAETVATFNASCGPTVYRGDLLGDAYRGHAFVCEPLSGVVHHRRLDPAGPTFVARRVEAENGREFLASTHPWFRPVNLATGPDGALYVADFCRAWVEHPAFVPEALRDSVDFREGHGHGRLWRVLPRAKAPRPEPCRPGGEDTASLLAFLGHPNGWCRDTAQRLLVEQHDPAAVEPLRKLARGAPAPLARVHALWTLEGLSALDARTLREALRDAEPTAREQAARLAEGRPKDFETELSALATDPDPRVRLRAAVALGGLASKPARAALAGVADRDAGSSWTSLAVLCGLGESPTEFLATLAARYPSWLTSPGPEQARFLARLAAVIGARGREPEIVATLGRISDAPGEAAAIALLDGLARGQGRLKSPRLTWNAPQPGQLGSALTRVERVRTAAAAVARADDRPAWLRVTALDLLLETRSSTLLDLVPVLLDPRQPADLQTAAARAVARADDPALAGAVLEDWDRRSLMTRRVLLASFVTSPPLAERMIEAVERGRVPASEIDPVTRDSLRRLNAPRLRERVARVLEASAPGDRRDVVRRYEPALTSRPDPSRGPELFARHCQSCHARNGQGPKVGPDLASVAGRPEADLLVAILDPSREVAPDGLGVVVVTTRGTTLTGLLAEETPAAVRLRRPDGLDEVIPRQEVESLRSTGRSLMPDGLEQVLTPRDLADLIAYLKQPPGKGHGDE